MFCECAIVLWQDCAAQYPEILEAFHKMTAIKVES